MPSLIGTTVAANYLKTSPTTQFGTRALRIIKIVAANGGDSDIDFTAQKYTVTGATTGAFTGAYTDGDSYFNAAVRGIQTVAEIYAVGQPDATTFLAVVAAETVNDSDTADNVPGGWTDLSDAIKNALALKLGNKTPVASVGFVANTAITVTAIDVAGGASNFVAGAVGSLV